MTISIRNWLCGFALAGAAALSAASWAMGPPQGMEHDPARMLAHITKQLDLSAEQQASVESLLTAARQAGAADRQRMQELRSQLKGMRDNFDATQARKVADEIGQITGRMVYQASETWSQVYQLLDAGQKAELDSLMSQREERRARRRDGGDKPAQ
ncbi:MAG: Spy/CpxP family protein refolding chaperone [Halioglobus sp.]|nr:Spy/CpxP family protein refolding chaperone [Halioglobus sp.]MCB1709695.1 Spy/CpxP family protein refolding chaperone [Halioglobus sp.]MCP5122042.1 Spy/CpxP family protein refolding chaperone [Pseudomonadales bacterium]MCP5192412.1 Spy/CpxP family protein refolding chaperone [Pseudomonadales bacterium]